MSQQERLQILKMVQDGKVTAEEGARLLEAVELPDARTETAGQSARWLRVRVTDTHTGKSKVNINLPATLLTWAIKFIPQGSSVGQDEIMALIRNGGVGKIVDIDEDDERVEISLE